MTEDREHPECKEFIDELDVIEGHDEPRSKKPMTYEETSKQIGEGFADLCRAALAGDNDACFAFRNLTACLRDAGVVRALNLTADDLPAHPVPTDVIH